MAPSEIPHIPSNRPAVPATHLVPTLIYSLLKSPQGALLPPEHLPKAEVCPAHPAHWPSGDPSPPPPRCASPSRLQPAGGPGAPLWPPPLSTPESISICSEPKCSSQSTRNRIFLQKVLPISPSQKYDPPPSAFTRILFLYQWRHLWLFETPSIVDIYSVSYSLSKKVKCWGQKPGLAHFYVLGG